MQNFTFTVTTLTNTIKTLLENQQTFKGFVLKGEISNFTNHRSGHLYFALKDENAQIRAIMFSTHAQALNFKPKDGDKVTVTGSISLYAPQGSYSVQVTSMRLDGAGELYLKYLELKEKLKNLGWFDKEKKLIPKYPKRIGVVTSPTGAVIEDISNTVNRRYRLTEIILYPALVQGANSSKSIANQIIKANDDNLVDVLIVGRGGGSIEDLWGFNELETISAIYHSKIPVITAIGHETDDTISDLVSDLRAPTPTAAAELATPNTNDLISYLNDVNINLEKTIINLVTNYQSLLINHSERLEVSSPLNKLNQFKLNLFNLSDNLNKSLNSIIENQKVILNNYNERIKLSSPVNKLKDYQINLNNFKVNLGKNYNYIIERKKENLNYLEKEIPSLGKQIYINKAKDFNYTLNILEKINPLAIMKRGFTLTKDSNGNIITSVEKVKEEDLIEVLYYDGNLKAKVIEKEHNNGK